MYDVGTLSQIHSQEAARVEWGLARPHGGRLLVHVRWHPPPVQVEISRVMRDLSPVSPPWFPLGRSLELPALWVWGNGSGLSRRLGSAASLRLAVCYGPLGRLRELSYRLQTQVSWDVSAAGSVGNSGKYDKVGSGWVRQRPIASGFAL